MALSGQEIEKIYEIRDKLTLTYKVSTDEEQKKRVRTYLGKIEKIIRDNNARILSVEEDYIVIEKTGHKEETQELLEKLHPFNVLEFVRSGRVAMMKQKENFSDTLHELEKAYHT